MAEPLISIPGVELLEELGRGAHSVVFRARRKARFYAVKVPLPDQTSSDAESVARRFRREAIVLARLQHPALPAVMEVGQASGLPYLIMELVAGETLSERLSRGPLSASQTLELTRQLADVFVEIHANGLVHRDVKPSNILFDPHTRAARLVDFGFAAATLPNSRNSTQGVPQSVRSWAFEPGQDNDEGADLYALGAVLFECLTGLPPSAAVDPLALLTRYAERSRSDALEAAESAAAAAQIASGLLFLGPAPGYRSARELRRDLPRIDGRSEPAGLEHQDAATGSVLARSMPLLGRERELDRLSAAWRTSAAGRGQVVVIRGGSGSGKSRLIQALHEDVLREGCPVFTASCDTSDPRPFAAVRALIETHVQGFERLGLADRLQKTENFRGLASDLAPLLKVLSPHLARVFRDAPLLPRAEGAEHILAEGLAEFLRKLLQESGPALILIDDIQWLDSGSRRVLARLAERAASSSALCVFVGRDDPESLAAIERLLGGLEPEKILEVRLGALEERRIVELVRVYLGREDLGVDLLRYVTGVSDGTPLSVIETVRAMLDTGVLVPSWGQWKFDAVLAGRMDLPRGSRELLTRRLGELDAGTVQALSAAAVIGKVFEATLLPDACGLSADRVGLALAEARRALLVEAIPELRCRFVHDSVREVLLRRLDEPLHKLLHQRVAEALDRAHELRLNEEPSSSQDPTLLDLTYRLATHYAAGAIEQNPKRVFEACIAAGELAFRSFDNDLSLRFFDSARLAAELLGADFAFDVDLDLMVAEARLRTGAFTPSLEHFRRVAQRSADAPVRALALSRIAWIEIQLDTDRAWAALDDAFKALGVRPPADSVLGLVGSLVAWVWRGLPRTRRAVSLRERRTLEVLCSLYYQAGRLAAETLKPLRLLQAVLRGLDPAERLGPSAALVKSYLSYSFVLTVLGWRRASKHYLSSAERIALGTRDPMVYAHVLQVRAVIAVWAGDIQDALDAGARSMTEYGHWRELSEFCLTAYNQQQIEAILGRNVAAWSWLERAVAKLANHEGVPMALEFIELSVRAALTALGREHEAQALLSRLAKITVRPPARGAVVASSHGSRARLFTECGQLDDAFEFLVEEVAAVGYDPRRVHLEMTEYYVHVAHARVHACLRATPGELPRRIAALRGPLGDLQLAARVPLLRAHARVIEAYFLWLSGQTAAGIRRFAEAEELGTQAGAPWILYAVHRGRAHMLRSAGRKEAALDQARLAEALAREHGATYRLRWIREEFGLPGESSRGKYGLGSSLSAAAYRSAAARPESDSGLERQRARGYLRSLVGIGQQTAKELDLAQQARAVLDELIQVLRAERGFLFLSRDRLQEDQAATAVRSERSPSLEPTAERKPGHEEALVRLAARRDDARDLEPQADYGRRLVEELFVFGVPESELGGASAMGSSVTFHEDRAVVATPLLMRGGTIGVLYFDRPLRAGVFGESDGRMLVALAGQVPLVLELSRSLRARELAKQTQQSSEKLEAVGRLAGGIAHDFNNMLSVILTASDEILTERSVHDVADEVRTIRGAAERARDLTHQLLAFSRGQYLNPEVVQINELVLRLESIFKRLLGDGAKLELELDPDLCRVQADPAQIDQVLTNLVVNAGDAMREGGRLQIQTSNVQIDPARVEPHGPLRPGRYARIVVTDNGQGMDELTRAKAFEPFFTTKSERSGTGLGLATAYGIVAQSGGHIELDSELGTGTSFRIFLPETTQALTKRPSYRTGDAPALRRGSGTILLVDDEPLVRESMRRTLAALGYRVLAAESSAEALDIAQARLDTLDLVITDVIMPEMNGLELARELSRLRPSVKILFASGYTAGVLAERGVLRDRVEFLQKPIPTEALAQRVWELTQCAPNE